MANSVSFTSINMLDFEKKFYSKTINFIAGTDEAGRGPIVGPVVAAAVIFPKDYKNEDINDSKKLSTKKREALEKIIKKDALSYAVSFISAKEIDKINIYEASRKAMITALHNLKHKYHMVITDAMPLPMEACKVIPLVKGDAKSLAVAAASILAKVARDRYMDELDKKYPKYKFKEHKGYPTKEHLRLLKELGPIDSEYRFSYKPVKDLHYQQLSLL
ncbi:MAG: ribonuclease HII [Bacilli bacterium]|nr:ribonuclease HII [Bacilli bacterium]